MGRGPSYFRPFPENGMKHQRKAEKETRRGGRRDETTGGRQGNSRACREPKPKVSGGAAPVATRAPPAWKTEDLEADFEAKW
eukprot:6199516-Pleurochrysis_carterae.AAC.1